MSITFDVEGSEPNVKERGLVDSEDLNGDNQQGSQSIDTCVIKSDVEKTEQPTLKNMNNIGQNLFQSIDDYIHNIHKGVSHYLRRFQNLFYDFRDTARNLSYKHPIGIDFGTSTIKICSPKGKIFEVPSCVAVDNRNVVAYGEEALGYQLNGKVRFLVDHGKINDSSLVAELLSHLFNGNGLSKSLKVIGAVPKTDRALYGDKRILNQVIDSVYLGDSSLVYQPIAAMIGILGGLNENEAVGRMIVSVGGGLTQVAVISMGDFVSDLNRKKCMGYLEEGGKDIDHSIMDYFKEKYHFDISRQIAEYLKIKYGTIYGEVNEDDVVVKGYDKRASMPKAILSSPTKIRQAMMHSCFFDRFVETIRLVLERTPPEILADISDGRAFLSGGCARLPGLADLLKAETGLNFCMSETPEHDVIHGVRLIAKRAMYKKYLH